MANSFFWLPKKIKGLWRVFLIDTDRRETVPKEERVSFEVSRDLIWNVFFNQHVSNAGALAELVQNSFDAGATEIELTINEHGFTIKDNGKGFSSRNDILRWFRVFGSQERKIDEQKFGRFRMGRGQIMGKALTNWRSGAFEMQVDIKTKGLDFDLITHQEILNGCVVDGSWYDLKDNYSFQPRSTKEVVNDIIRSLTSDLKYIPNCKITLNGELVNHHSMHDGQIMYEDDDFFFIKHEHKPYNEHNITVRNLGITVDKISIGFLAGTVVTKKHLNLNISRSAILGDCELFSKIKNKLRDLAPKYSRTKKYNHVESQKILNEAYQGGIDIDELIHLKLFPDLHSRHYYTLKELSAIPFIVHSAGAKFDHFADHVDQTGEYIVLDHRVPSFHSGSNHIDREEGDNAGFETTFTPCRILLGILKNKEVSAETDKIYVEIIESVLRNQKAAQSAYNEVSMDKLIISEDDITKREKAAIKALNRTISDSRMYIKILVGYDPDKQCAAWTDGSNYIAMERSTLALAEKGMRGATAIMQILFHELSHMDSNDHHDGAFYKRFHDLLMSRHSNYMFEALYDASRAFVVNYDRFLESYRVPRSRSLDKSLMLAMKKYRTRKESVAFHNRKDVKKAV